LLDSLLQERLFLLVVCFLPPVWQDGESYNETFDPVFGQFFSSSFSPINFISIKGDPFFF